MTSVPHIYVLPIGVPRPRRVCLVCQAQDRLGMAVFLNPPAPAMMATDAPTVSLMAEFGRLQPELGAAFTSIVVQHGTVMADEGGVPVDRVAPGVTDAVVATTSALGAAPFRAALADPGVIETLPIARQTGSTILLYRYRQIVDVQSTPADDGRAMMAAFSGLDVSGRLAAFVRPHLGPAR